MSEKSKKVLTVVSSEVSYQGTGKNGKEFTIYSLGVLDSNGQPIDEKFKSFDNIVLDKQMEFDVEKTVHEKYGTEYMLRPPKGGSIPPVAGGVLAEQIAALTARVEALEGMAGVTPRPAGAAGAVAPAAPVEDDDIPF